MPQRLHLIAMGGSVMHNLAIALHRQGHRVSGSDDAIFDPSRSRLESEGLLPDQMGWDPARITAALDGVILGMHARTDNPELARAMALGLPVWSFPEYVYRNSSRKLRAAVCGSHGKTTITAMVMHVLQEAGRDFDYLVGAQLEGFDVMVRLSEAPLIVLEGDEYLSSPVDREPKFVHYHPNRALLSGIAWDHVNVFPTYEEYLEAFRKLIRGLQAEDRLIYNEEDPEVLKLVEEGLAGTALAYRCPDFTIREGLLIARPEGLGELPMQVIGRHNLLNAAGAARLCESLGLDYKASWRSLAGFPGAARRLELLYREGGRAVIRDFAHSPSKAGASTEAVAGQFGRKGLVACLELHTFSSLDPEFIPQYKGTLDSAERAVVFFDPEAVQAKGLPPLSKADVQQAFAREDLIVIADPAELAKRFAEWGQDLHTLLVMSSGPLGGLRSDDLVNFVRPA